MNFSHTEIIGYSAGLISFLNMFWYMRGIIRGEIKPALAYWLLAEIAMLLIVASSYSLGDRTSLWIAVAYASTQIVIIGLALWARNTNITRLDIGLFALAGVSIWLWWYTDNPLYTLIINVGIDASGYIPLWRSIWKNPENEDKIYWWIAACACILNMFSVRDITPTAVLYPWYLGIINSITFILLFRKIILSYGKKILS